MRLVSYICALALLLMGAYAYGRFSHIYKWFPEKVVRAAIDDLRQLKASRNYGRVEYLVKAAPGPKLVVHGTPSPGLRLISSVSRRGDINVQAIDAKGALAHRWDLDWFETWKGPTDHIPEAFRPQRRPGAGVAGMVVSPDGDLTFNYDNLGMVQMDVCGKVKWRLARQTHHSLVQDEDGDFWAPAMVTRSSPQARLPNYKPPFRDFSILEVSPDGRVKREIFVADLLLRNGLGGMLYLGTTDNESTSVTGDTLHLNDVDVFPSTLKPGVARPGDIMISLRNPNAVLIFDPATLQIRAMVRDRFIRQHDPDFVDGDHITLFDNNNVDDDLDGGAQSRIVSIDLRDETVTPLFGGSAAAPFYTRIMGRAEPMANGHMLLSEAEKGRLVEVAPGGQVVWAYRNLAGGGMASKIEDAGWTAVDLKALARRCGARPSA